MSHENINVTMQQVNLEFHKIITFFRSLKLALHPSKTKFMVFSNSNQVNLNINFNNENEDNISKIFVAERVVMDNKIPAVKFLGVFFYPQLNFNYHIKSITSKLSKALYMLRSTKNVLPLKARKAVYYTLFHCHLIYCLPIWSCTSSANINTMSILQKKAVRIVAAENYNAHTQPIFKSQKILPFDKFIEEVFTQKARQTVQSSFLSGGQDRMPHWECLVCMCVIV